MILLVLAIPFSQNEKMLIYKIIGIICSASCMLLTNVVHMVNLTVTDQLIRKGIEIPYYLLIGKWPSVGMAIDYLAWGFFMGIAFLFSSFGVEKVSVFKSIKITLFVCGCLCFTGFFGAILFNQNLWYIAPLGYGIGTMLICFELLILNKKIN